MRISHTMRKWRDEPDALMQAMSTTSPQPRGRQSYLVQQTSRLRRLRESLAASLGTDRHALAEFCHHAEPLAPRRLARERQCLEHVCAVPDRHACEALARPLSYRGNGADLSGAFQVVPRAAG